MNILLYLLARIVSLLHWNWLFACVTLFYLGLTFFAVDLWCRRHHWICVNVSLVYNNRYMPTINRLTYSLSFLKSLNNSNTRCSTAKYTQWYHDVSQKNCRGGMNLPRKIQVVKPLNKRPLNNPYSALSPVLSTNVVCVKTQQKYARIKPHQTSW